MSKDRSLTKGEIALAQSLFGDSIDYSKVRIHDHPVSSLQPAFSGVTPNGEIYTRDTYSDDYAQAQLRSRGFFIHEMVHVWQYQNNILNPIAEGAKDLFNSVAHRTGSFLDPAKYRFDLDEKKDLTDYKMEQQAAIIQYYYLECSVSKGAPSDRRALYEKVLAKFLKDPGYARKKPPRFRPPHFGR